MKNSRTKKNAKQQWGSFIGYLAIYYCQGH